MLKLSKKFDVFNSSEHESSQMRLMKSQCYESSKSEQSHLQIILQLENNNLHIRKPNDVSIQEHSALHSHIIPVSIASQYCILKIY